MPKSVRQLLQDAETDILMRMDPVRKELNLLERELADIRKARNALNTEGLASTVVRVVGVGDLRKSPVMSYGGGEAIDPKAAPSPYAELTMKQLVRKALDEHFTNGATAIELLDFFRNAWGRHDIVRTSLSPQLSRLKRDKVIELDGYVWQLAGSSHEKDPEDESSGSGDVGAGRAGPRLAIQGPSGSTPDASTSVRGEGDTLPFYQSADPKG